MTKAITAHGLKARLGGILQELQTNQFVILRRNIPVGVLLSVQDYVAQHSDQYENVEDFLDTLLEESDPEFQRSLARGGREARKGHYLSHTQLKLALANKKMH